MASVFSVMNGNGKKAAVSALICGCLHEPVRRQDKQWLSANEKEKGDGKNIFV